MRLLTISTFVALASTAVALPSPTNTTETALKATTVELAERAVDTKIPVQRWNSDDIEVAPGQYATWNCSYEASSMWNTYRLTGTNWHRDYHQIKHAIDSVAKVTKWKYAESLNFMNQTYFEAHFRLPIMETKKLEKKLNGLLGTRWNLYEGPKCPDVLKNPMQMGAMDQKKLAKQAQKKKEWQEKYPEWWAMQEKENERVKAEEDAAREEWNENHGPDEQI